MAVRRLSKVAGAGRCSTRRAGRVSFATCGPGVAERLRLAWPAGGMQPDASPDATKTSNAQAAASRGDLVNEIKKEDSHGGTETQRRRELPAGSSLSVSACLRVNSCLTVTAMCGPRLRLAKRCRVGQPDWLRPSPIGC